VTFADRKVRAALAPFALAWKNIKDDPSCGSSYRHGVREPAEAELPRGIGDHNVQLLFLTPDAKLLHVLAGFWPAKDLLREIDFVRVLLAEARKGGKRLAALHRAHAAEDRVKFRVSKDECMPSAVAADLEERGSATGWKSSHAYMVDHVLLPVERFRASDLVGEGSSFFGVATERRTRTFDSDKSEP
jgi:hypothetical protein